MNILNHLRCFWRGHAEPVLYIRVVPKISMDMGHDRVSLTERCSRCGRVLTCNTEVVKMRPSLAEVAEGFDLPQQ